LQTKRESKTNGWFTSCSLQPVHRTNQRNATHCACHEPDRWRFP